MNNSLFDGDFPASLGAETSPDANNKPSLLLFCSQSRDLLLRLRAKTPGLDIETTTRKTKRKPKLSPVAVILNESSVSGC